MVAITRTQRNKSRNIPGESIKSLVGREIKIMRGLHCQFPG